MTEKQSLATTKTSYDGFDNINKDSKYITVNATAISEIILFVPNGNRLADMIYHVFNFIEIIMMKISSK